MKKRIHKKDAIQLLTLFGLPTVRLIDLKHITDEQLREGLSVRLYYNATNKADVNLPSIHNCTNIRQILIFIESHNQYGYFIHKTVCPKLIGSVSRRTLDKTCIVFEVYPDFSNRENVQYRYCLDDWEGKYYPSVCIGDSICPPDIIVSLRKFLIYLKRVPYPNYTAEIVIDDLGILFTDLVIEE